jgi:hypothetical protein
MTAFALLAITRKAMPDTLEQQEAADRAMRHWRLGDSAPIKPGSDAHKRMFCRMLLETHNPYKPAVIEWPQLPPDALARVTSLPIWDIAVQTEGRASIGVATYAASVRDPLLREALELDGAEEARHKVVLSKLVGAYGIKLAPEPDYPAPRDAEWAWMMTGLSECIDSFFAFGLFRSAQLSGFFPEALIETFEPVIQEEARHILFFANWFAWHRRNLPWWKRPWFFARVLAVWFLRRAGCELRGDGRFERQCRHQPACADRALSRRERATHERLRRPPAAASLHAACRKVRTPAPEEIEKEYACNL